MRSLCAAVIIVSFGIFEPGALARQPVPGAGPPEAIDSASSLLLENARAAVRRLQSSLDAHGGGAMDRGVVVYAGRTTLEGHFMRPGTVRTRPVQIRVAWDSAAGVVRADEAEVLGGRDNETLVADHGRIAAAPRADAPFEELSGARGAEALVSATSWLPQAVLSRALAAGETARLLPQLRDGDATLDAVAFVDIDGRPRTIAIDAATGLVRRVECLIAHPRLGDACEWTEFSGYSEGEPPRLPRTIVRFTIQPSTTLRYEVERRPREAPERFSPEDATLPAGRAGAIEDWGRAARAPQEDVGFRQLAPGLFAAEIAASDSRALVIERADSLVLLEMPEDTRVVAGLLRALRERWADKPVRAAAFGHHHPASAGGVRELAATGATILAPAGLRGFIDGELARRFVLRPDTLAAGTGEPVVEYFDGESTIDAGEATVRLIDIGETSAHAYHYVVFYFPRCRLLFEGDLGMFPLEGATRAGPRLAGLCEAVRARGLDVERLVQAWPVKGVRAEVPWAEVTALVEAAARK